MCRVAAGADLADGVRVAGAQAGIAADTRPRLRAARSPALVRSAISARSSWATAPSTDDRRATVGQGAWAWGTPFEANSEAESRPP
jgi:hypothetical protein